jgi:hypothetical protein
LLGDGVNATPIKPISTRRREDEKVYFMSHCARTLTEFIAPTLGGSLKLMYSDVGLPIKVVNAFIVNGN